MGRNFSLDTNKIAATALIAAIKTTGPNSANNARIFLVKALKVLKSVKKVALKNVDNAEKSAPDLSRKSSIQSEE